MGQDKTCAVTLTATGQGATSTNIFPYICRCARRHAAVPQPFCITSAQGLTLEDIRHVWILLTQAAVDAYCTTVNQETKRMLMEVAARLSGHSPEVIKAV